MLAAGVARLLGHKDVKMTARYAHADTGKLREALGKTGDTNNLIWLPQ